MKEHNSDPYDIHIELYIHMERYIHIEWKYETFTLLNDFIGEMLKQFKGGQLDGFIPSGSLWHGFLIYT